MKTPKKLWYIESNGLVNEYYFIGTTLLEGCGIYANRSGHYPKRVFFNMIREEGFYLTEEAAVNAATKIAESLIALLKRKE